jgi:predicted regulator of Ras-like GTPase activity (Roadblock/LC7/MglB family)
MSKTKKEKLDDVLTGLMQVGQITACGVDARIFSAICSKIMGAAEAVSGQMTTGTVAQI